MTSDVPFEDPRRVLARHGLRPKRGYSQNFLVAASAQAKIVGALELSADETVVELGPGVGTLTAGLLATRANVIAIERDPAMIDILAIEFPTLDVRREDAAEVDLASLGSGPTRAIAGNLPYAVTGRILRNLVRYAAAISRAVIMIQREVRDRLLAAPGTREYGALTVFVTNRFEVENVLLVPPGSFFPPPRVHSAVVRLRSRSAPRAPESTEFESLVRAAFQARRKKLRNTIRQFTPDVSACDALLAEASIDGNRRPETLSVEEFSSLASIIAAGRFPKTQR